MPGIGQEPSIREIPATGGVLEMVVFDKLPKHDSTWGLCTGVDGTIWWGVCGEHTGGLSVFIVSYDPVTRELDYRIECGPALGQPPDDGHATQSKIHYCLLPQSDGKLVCATHCSGPPINERAWSAHRTWYDPVSCFPGSHFFTFDPESNTIDDWGIALDREGCRCLALDEKRRKLYAITFPRNHFVAYDIETRTLTDLGRIGEINPQAVFLDRDNNAYTTDDYGYILRYRPDEGVLERLSACLPIEGRHRRGWHNVLYDVIPALDWSCLYGCDWGYESHLFRYDPYDGPDGRVDDLGRPELFPEGFRTDYGLEQSQLRGLVFGRDGRLYYTIGAGWKQGSPRLLARLDLETGKSELLCEIDYEGRMGQHIASATCDFYGNLYFAEAGRAPTRFFVYRPDDVDMTRQVFSFDDIKPWG